MAVVVTLWLHGGSSGSGRGCVAWWWWQWLSWLCCGGGGSGSRHIIALYCMAEATLLSYCYCGHGLCTSCVKATVGLRESPWELLTKQFFEGVFKKDISETSDLRSPDF